MNTLCTQSTTSLCTTEKFHDACKSAAQIIPARRNSIATLLSSMGKFVAAKYQQRIDRQAFQTMLRLDEHMLKDIGVTKMDVKWANQLPLSQDAATELEIIARRR